MPNHPPLPHHQTPQRRFKKKHKAQQRKSISLEDLIRPILRVFTPPFGLFGPEPDDATTVIICSEALSEMLKLAIIFKIRHEPSRSQLKELFGFEGPLGTFSSRITMCSTLGMFPPEMTQDLNTVRDIRNKFCHTTVRRSFSDTEIVERCRALKYRDQASSRHDHAGFYKDSVDVPKLLAAQFKNQWKSRLVYSTCAVTFNLLLILFVEYEEAIFLDKHREHDVVYPAKERYDSEVMELLMKALHEAFEKFAQEGPAKTAQ